MTIKPELIIEEKIHASKEAVYKAFSSAEALKEWWGPVESPIDVVFLDFKPGGKLHYRMNGEHQSYGVKQYLETIPNNKIVWLNSFADENGNPVQAPFEGLVIPVEIKNSITLTEEAGVTTLVLTAEPHNATEAEIAGFISIIDGMKQGFGGTFNQLLTYLQKA